MILIWGFRSLLKALSEGEFHCPRCQADRRYHLMRPRRWFTFFFIPVIPLQWGEPFVECVTCKGAYVQAVLSAPTNRQFSYMLALGARAMFAKAVAAGFAHSEAHIDSAVSVLRTLVGEEYNEANLIADIEGFSGHALSEYLGPLASGMEVNGRERLLTELISWAYEGGEPPAGVREVVAQGAADLQLTAAHLAGIVATVTGVAPTIDPT
jgi:hypothetical protein